MRRFLGLAAVMVFGAATGAHAQSGPINHKAPAGASAAQPPVEPDMSASPPPAPPPPPPPQPPQPDVGSQLGQVRATIQNDLDQHKISRRRAAHLLRKLKVIGDQAEALNHSMARIVASLP